MNLICYVIFHTECPRGKYGISCNSDCGHCADSITCHHITGTCPGGCKAGWKLPLCKTAIITPVTAAMIGVAGGICFTVVLAVVLFVGLVKLWRFKW
ncbi:uncharacterized protein LOC124290696 [Haliotis rubra]|uniref:uncharacterized protein LOC124290696 n=1 Tax=Haliotis rubra TaxID=36100 RepID=UPI001EE62800|nr:uncharacterized protein LOC124290696 [Haliotis rubra]